MRPASPVTRTCAALMNSHPRSSVRDHTRANTVAVHSNVLSLDAELVICREWSIPCVIENPFVRAERVEAICTPRIRALRPAQGERTRIKAETGSCLLRLSSIFSLFLCVLRVSARTFSYFTSRTHEVRRNDLAENAELAERRHRHRQSRKSTCRHGTFVLLCSAPPRRRERSP
jgi:hypothetical protein